MSSLITPCPDCGTQSSENYGGTNRCYESYLTTLEDEPAVSSVRFVSPAELVASVPAEPPWIWRGYVARGALTLISGKPKSGKSTLALALTEAISSGKDSFLGHELESGPAVFVSEEGGSTSAHKLDG